MDEVASLIARADGLKADRYNFDAFWQEVADFMMPSREFTRTSSPGQKRMSRIYNTMPILAAEQLAGGLHGMLTSPQLRWFALRCTDARFANSQAAQEWFASATDRMYEHFNSPLAGFATSSHEVYMDIAGFGTGAMYIQDAGRRGPIYRSVPLREAFIAEGEDGRVDTMFRQFQMSARNVVSTWPETCGAQAREIAEKRPDQPIDIIHAVTPRAGGEAWDSRYVLKDHKTILERKRYRGFPFVVPRWTKRSGEIYGTGAGMNALPDVRLLNKIEETNLRGAQKMIDPPLMVPDDGFLTPVSTRPGSINVYRAGIPGDGDMIRPLDTKGRPDIGRDMIELMQARIEGIFYTRWMNLPSQPNMTATEVIQRRDEMLRLLGPMVARLTAEFCGPVIERTFTLMLEGGLFEPLPRELAGAEWTVEYLSPLAISQKTQDADAIIRWFQVASQMATIDPTVLDAMDMPEAARFLADRYSAPPGVMRSREDQQARADAREQAAAAEREMMAADTAARVGKTGAQAMREFATAQQVGQQQEQMPA